MNWLKRKIKEHNERLTYVDYEEHWTTGEWICNLILLTALSVVPLTIIAVQEQKPITALCGLVLGAFVAWWHFWNIMH
jgi:hypothetical protein